MPLNRLAGRLGRRARVKRPSADQQVAIARKLDGVLERLPPPWRKTCLTRSVALYHLLRRTGIPIDLCVGVKKGSGEFVAHAWLSRDGVPYLEPEGATEFKVITQFPDPLSPVPV